MKMKENDMYRKEIKVLDCTIRDGGLINGWNFSDKLVKSVFKAINDSGVDYMEIGYKACKKIINPDGLGKWRFCDEDHIKKLISDIDYSVKISAMVDIGRVDSDIMLPAKDSVLDMIRVASYVKDVDKAIDLVKKMHDKGYETTVNIMAVSHAREQDLTEALEQLAKSEVGTVYIVDSFGSLFCEPVEQLIKKSMTILKDKTVGMHAHNNQQLGFANTIEAIIHGANMLDATITGIGRGAGNCPLELLIGFLKNPKFRLRPIIEVIENEFVDLRKEIEWGYLIPYAITGILDQHPRQAMKVRKSEDKDKYTKFFDEMNSDHMIF
jgi:4-hydroxy 2-oxovalerate aldolase